MTEAHHRTVLRDVGQCIYCGANEALTEEHVVPFALGGNLVLANASCKRCAGLTSAFEGRVLKGFMLDARVVANYPTRHPKRRPTSLKMGWETLDGGIETVFVPPSEHPGFLFMPRLATARAFGGTPPPDGVTVEGFETIHFGANPAQIAAQLGTKTIQVQANWDVSSFSRMLAKIAYAYAVGTRGVLPRDTVPVLPLIMGSTDDGSAWLGSAEFTLDIERKRPLHALATAFVDGQLPGTRGLVARVKLFASSGATGYEVLVQSQ